MSAGDVVIFVLWLYAALCSLYGAYISDTFRAKLTWLIVSVACGIVAGVYLNLVWEGN